MIIPVLSENNIWKNIDSMSENMVINNFLTKQNLSECFYFNKSDSLLKMKCYKENNEYNPTDLMCVRLETGYICM